MKTKKIAILGGGNLGIAMAEGLLKSGFTDPSRITVTRRRIHLIDFLKEKGINVTDNNNAAVKNADIIIICVKPHQIGIVLKEIKPTLDPSKHVLVSAVTGFSMADIVAITGPGIPLFRTMPNTALAIRESMTCISVFDKSKEDETALVTELFDHLGKTQVINEELMGAATVIGACGIAFALRFLRALSQGGIEIGFGADLAQQITAQTLNGASKLILESGQHPEKEIDKVTTPLGITISGLNEMEHHGFSSALIKGLLTSFNKLDSLKTKKS